MNRAEKRRLARQAGKTYGIPPAANVHHFNRPNLKKQRQIANPEQLLVILKQGHALYEQRRYEEAKLAYHAILQIDKSYADANNSLGLIEAEMAKPGLAESWFDKAIKADPKRPNFHNNRGLALLELDRFQEAIDCFKATLKLEPKFVPAMCNLGKAYNKLKEPNTAIEWLEKAIEAQPDFYNAYMELSTAYGELGNFDTAVQALEQVLEMKGDDIAILSQLSQLLTTYGKFDQVINTNRRILKLQPGNPSAYHNITRVKKFEYYDDDMKEIENAYTKIPDADYNEALIDKQKKQDRDHIKMNLASALAKAFESIKEYDKAFKFFQEANRQRRKQFSYYEQETFCDFEARRTVFSPAMIKQFYDQGNPDPTPIFIVGMPRSGTTLLEQVFHSHKDVFGAGELTYMRDILQKKYMIAEKFQEAYQAGHITVDFFRDIGKAYIEKIRKLNPDIPFITDKMPHNFLNIGFIKLALPNAKIIHNFRNPIDNCFAIFKQMFGNEGHQYGYDLVELGHYHNKYRELMAHWETVFPGEILENRYEDMVEDLEKQTRRVLAFCGLEWDENCLNFHQAERAVRTASVAQVRQPIYKSSVEKWRKYEKQLQPLIRALKKGPAF